MLLVVLMKRSADSSRDCLKSDWKHKFYWGWLRIILGQVQMSSAIIAFSFACVVGAATPTYVAGAVALTSLVLSRILYGGRSDPNLRD